MRKYILLLLVALWVTTCNAALGVCDVKVRVLRQAAATSTGNQDFIVAGLGTPKGAIVLMNYAIANSTAAANAAWSIGVTDCTNQGVVHTQDRADGTTTTDTNRRSTTTAVAELLEAGTANGATLDGIGSVSCIADGIRINWTTAMSAGFFVHVLFLGGSDMQTKVGTFDQNSTVDASVDITTVGFTPEGVFCLSAANGSATWDNSNVANARWGFGVATASAQGHMAQAINDNVTTTAYGGGGSNQYACNSSLPADFLDGPVELGSFDSQGFTATTRSESQSFRFLYLAYTTNGKARSWAGELAAPASAQVQSYTGPGWRPQAYIMFMTGTATINTELTDDTAARMGVGIGDAWAQYCVLTRGDDNVGTVNAKSHSTATAVDLRATDGSNFWLATLTGFTPVGWDLNFTTSNAAGAWFGWAIEDAARRPQRALWFQ